MKQLTAATLLVLSVAALTACSSPAKSATPSTTPALKASVAATVTVPDLVGVEADVARKKLEALHLKHKYVAPGGSYVVLASDWTVKSESPTGGKVPPKSTVTLHVVKTASYYASPVPSAEATTPATLRQRYVALCLQYVAVNDPGGDGFQYAGALYRPNGEIRIPMAFTEFAGDCYLKNGSVVDFHQDGS